MSKQSLQDRISEYVNSKLMTHRLKIGKILSCKIRGKFGVYRTTFDLDKGETTNCSCPAEYWPCKHSYALAKTYEIAPETFIDTKKQIKNLQKKNKTQLIKIIEKMIRCAPDSITALGIKGFNIKENENENEEDWNHF